ncbi:MAG: hypothetical protein HFF59_09680 [Lawsonibacter sp.]|jgi:hypothetical protein|uniref:hypothetical protein n=1 Tax=Lawsonibacter sp. JLR.KK007 TaxID=3114293 RepID=UPI00216F3ECD|nr:hypothetical protein [Lawsonibacter sp.]MCI8991063.1 hypothetical protein [Lawsonibacter sp.]MCI9268572.1 hypothetical protein [Lawsonibacter sp.]
MNVTPIYNTGQLALIRNARSAPSQEHTAAGQSQDQLELSQEGRQVSAQAEKAALLDMTKEDIMSMAQEQLEEQRLEINWNASVDPDGQIWCKAYFDSYTTQAVQFRDTAENAIQDYYAAPYQEALNNPLGSSLPQQLNFIAAKYQCSWSDFFDASIPADQRQWTYTQVRAMLTGTGLRLNDPFALKDISIPTVEETSKIAKQEADNTIRQLAGQAKEQNG